jgi:nucleotide-binding universal stress UspA family protein
MFTIEKILLPVDFQEVSKPLIHQAAVLARHFHSEIVILHVLTPLSFAAGMLEGSYVPSSITDLQAELLRQAQKNLNQFLAVELSGLVVKRLLLEGEPARMIVQSADQEKASLIIMSTHGYRAFRRFLLGSVTAKVLHDSQCPVWTGAHLEQPPTRAFAVRNIACAIDLNEHSRKTVQWAAHFAAAFQAGLTLIHITPGVEPYTAGGYVVEPAWNETLLNCATADIAELQKEIGTSAKVAVESGEVAEHLDQAAQRAAADVLIIGRPTSGRLRATGYAIIRESHVPVLSV